MRSAPPSRSTVSAVASTSRPRHSQACSTAAYSPESRFIITAEWKGESGRLAKHMHCFPDTDCHDIDSAHGPGADGGLDFRKDVDFLIDIDSDGTIVWNNEPLSGIGALEAHFREESTRNPQAQIRLRPSARARYDVIAHVMTSAQRYNMTHMGFSNVSDYAH